MEHNKLCRAKAGEPTDYRDQTRRWALLLFTTTVPFMCRNKHALYLVNIAVPSLPKTGLMCLHSLFLENVRSNFVTLGKYRL